MPAFFERFHTLPRAIKEEKKNEEGVRQFGFEDRKESRTRLVLRLDGGSRKGKTKREKESSLLSPSFGHGLSEQKGREKGE